MRTQCCRENIEKVAQICELEPQTVKQIKAVGEFCKLHREISQLTTDAVKPLMDEPDPEIQGKAIQKLNELLIGKQGAGRGNKKKKRYTKSEVKEIIKDIKKEIEKERASKAEFETTTKTEEDNTDIKSVEEKTEVAGQTEDVVLVDNREQLKSNAQFNFTNDNIEWAKWTWNPVTGCKHGCKYCYAYDIATRFNENGFKPTYYPDRLSAPKNTKSPVDSSLGFRNVFVCSMADLFGDWVQKEWIDAVIKAVTESPEWTFIFLTKNPKRLIDFTFPNNAWVGATVDIQARVKPTEIAFKKVKAKVKFISVEPMLEPLKFNNLNLFDWVIIGGRSESSKMSGGYNKKTNPGGGQPEWRWVEDLLIQAREAKTMIYFKPNLTVRPKEYPQ